MGDVIDATTSTAPAAPRSVAHMSCRVRDFRGCDRGCKIIARCATPELACHADRDALSWSRVQSQLRRAFVKDAAVCRVTDCGCASAYGDGAELSLTASRTVCESGPMRGIGVQSPFEAQVAAAREVVAGVRPGRCGGRSRRGGRRRPSAEWGRGRAAPHAPLLRQASDADTEPEGPRTPRHCRRRDDLAAENAAIAADQQKQTARHGRLSKLARPSRRRLPEPAISTTA